MIDRNKLDVILGELEMYARDYAAAEADISKVKQGAIEAMRHDHTNGLDVKDLLDDMSNKLSDIELTQKVAKQCFYEQKDRLLKMVEKITLPNSWRY